MPWPREVQFESPETMSSSVWFAFREAFDDPVHISKAVSLFSQAAHYFRPITPFTPSLSPANRTNPFIRKSHLFNVTMALLGYRTNQSDRVLYDCEYIERKSLCHRNDITVK